MLYLSRRSLVLCAVLLCASTAHAQPATAIGVVVDSVHGRPLASATIVVSGTDAQAVSDSNGRFRIDSIPAGEHTMAVFHPLLDEMGLTLSTNKIAFVAGGTMAVVLATPSAQSWIARRCSDSDRQQGSGAVIGHVLQLTGDEPLTGALLHYTGTVLMAGKDIGLRHTAITRDASATGTGDFVICGVPPGALGAIRASKGRVATGDIPVDLTEAPLAVVTLRLPPDDSLAAHGGFVTGRIVDDKGKPVPAANVALRGGQPSTQATDSGTFILRDLPMGSQVLEIEKVGFPKMATVVTIIGPQQPAVVAIALIPAPAMSAEAALVSVGFVRRQLKGGGVFITADTIAKLKARNVSDLQPLLPQTRMSPTSTGPILVPTNASMARCIWYLVDGTPYQWRVGRSHFNEDVPAKNVAGIEYYEYGHVPKELSDRFMTVGFPHCSLIAIWTFASAGAPAT